MPSSSKPFPEPFFYTAKWTPKIASTILEHLVKTTLETRSTKHVEHVFKLNFWPLENVFEWNGCKVSLQQKACTSATNCQKSVEILRKCMQMDHAAQEKAMLKNRPQKSNKCSKMTPKWVPETDFILMVVVAQTAFGRSKWAPSAPKVLPMSETWTKNDTKEPPDLRKRAPKAKPFQSLARRTARSAYNLFITE